MSQQTPSVLPPSIVDAALARLFPEPDPYADDPVKWVREKLGGFLWSKQVEILESVRDNMYTAVQSCHGPGKSYSASAAVAWWLACHKLGEAFAVTTAPSWPQVEAILWREMRRRHREGNLPGRITLDCQWHMGLEGGKKGGPDEELIAMGRKPADYDEDTFQGIHARYFMAVLDEACGIPDQLWNAVLSLATNENSRILAIGNPEDPNSRFATICKPNSGWNVIKISAFDTPAFTGEPVPDWLLESLVSKMWVADRTRDWGEGSPIWTAKVKGEFPDVSDDYLFPPGLLERAFQNELTGLDKGRFGVDLARYGDDRSVMYRNRGGQIRLAKWWSKKDTHESKLEIEAEMSRFGTKIIPATMDIIGLGAGPFDTLRAEGYEVAGFQGSERALDYKKFKNRRSEAYWGFRELMEQDLIDLDRNDEKLTAELTSIMWGVDSQGRIYVEPKEDIKERLGISPDSADAAVLSTISVGSLRELAAMKNAVTGDLLRKVM